MKKAVSLMIALVLLALALTACDGKMTTTRTTTVTEAPAQNTKQPGATSTTQPAADAANDAADAPAEGAAGQAN